MVVWRVMRDCCKQGSECWRCRGGTKLRINQFETNEHGRAQHVAATWAAWRGQVEEVKDAPIGRSDAHRQAR